MPTDVLVEVDEINRDVVEISAPAFAVEIIEPAGTILVEVDDAPDVIEVENLAVVIDVILSGAPAAVIEVARETGVVEVESPIVVVEIVEGVAGGGGSEPSTSSEVHLEAANTLSGHRVVRGVGSAQADLASSDDASHAGFVIGITTGAAMQGDDATIQIAGSMIEVSFSFVPGPVYFNSIGVLTQTRPTSGFIQQVAVAVDTTEIVVQLGVPVTLQ